MKHSLFTAGRYVASVDKISVEDLVTAGVSLVLIDRDNTIVPRDTKELPPAIKAWLAHVQAAGIEVCIVSNNFHGSELARDAKEIGCGVVDHALKPLPRGLHAALARYGVDPAAAVMIGDQIFTDVVAANLAGVESILVRHQSARDLWYTQIFRFFERFVLKHQSFEGE